MQVPLLDRLGVALRQLLAWRRPEPPIRDRAALARFLQTRASYIAQTTLYGYLRTRAGVRFPELFHDDPFVESLNIAKWHVWLACLSDLAVYVGGMLCHRAGAGQAQTTQLIAGVVDAVLAETGTPQEAGPQFRAHAERVRARVALCDWRAQTDDDGPFTESPAALVQWAPVVEDLKALDEEIVRNSVRFRWNEIRQQLRTLLDAHSVLHDAQGQSSPGP